MKFGLSIPNALGASNAPVTRIDNTLCWVIGLLLAFGVVMVYSSSIALWEAPHKLKFEQTSEHYLLRHAISLVLSVLAGYIAFHITPRHWQIMARWLGGLTLLLLGLVLIPQIGTSAGGARRWLPLGIMQFQPSELAKFAMVLYAADYSVRKQRHDYLQRERPRELKVFWGIVWPMLLLLGFGGLLLLLEPDMGAFILITIIAIGILFVGGLNGWLLGAVIMVLALVFSAIIMSSPFRRERIFGYLDPWAVENSAGAAYQLTTAMIAMGLGGWIGQGLGKSLEKLNWLPEAHTDFIISIIGEELGFIAMLGVIGAFLWLIWRIVDIGSQADNRGDKFAGLAAFGVALWLGAQSMIHIGVNFGVLPTKGLTLPLISFGGSALLMNMVALALVLRIDYENRRKKYGRQLPCP